MNISKEKFESYISIQEEIECEAVKVLSLINDAKSINGYKCLNFVSIDDCCVYFEGDEYWRYGGHESHSYEFKSTLLFDLEERNDYLESISNKKDNAVITKVNYKKEWPFL